MVYCNCVQYATHGRYMGCHRYSFAPERTKQIEKSKSVSGRARERGNRWMGRERERERKWMSIEVPEWRLHGWQFKLSQMKRTFIKCVCVCVPFHMYLDVYACVLELVNWSMPTTGWNCSRRPTHVKLKMPCANDEQSECRIQFFRRNMFVHLTRAKKPNAVKMFRQKKLCVCVLHNIPFIGM